MTQGSFGKRNASRFRGASVCLALLPALHLLRPFEVTTNEVRLSEIVRGRGGRASAGGWRVNRRVCERGSEREWNAGRKEGRKKADHYHGSGRGRRLVGRSNSVGAVVCRQALVRSACRIEVLGLAQKEPSRWIGSSRFMRSGPVRVQSIGEQC